MAKVLCLFLVAFLAARASRVLADENQFVDIVETILKLAEQSELPDNFWLDELPKKFGQPPCNQNGSFDEYREELLNDHLNDDISQQLL